MGIMVPEMISPSCTPPGMGIGLKVPPILIVAVKRFGPITGPVVQFCAITWGAKGAAKKAK